MYFVVVMDSDIKYVSTDKEDCENYIENLRQEDLDYIEEENGISEDENPDAARFMADYEGDAESAEIVYVPGFDDDDEFYDEDLEITFTREEIENFLEEQE